MTLKIEVTVPQDEISDNTAARYLARAMSALGFHRAGEHVGSVPHVDGKPIGEEKPLDDAISQAQTEVPDAELTQDADEPKRERGKPAPGKARRTKAEIEEDEAADAADANTEAADEMPADNAEPEADAQDAEDEAADPVNAKGADATRDDVREAMLAYAAAKGQPALIADMSALLAEMYSDGSVKKLSEIPEKAEDFAAVIAALNAKRGA